jgi:hypothetical protein
MCSNQLSYLAILNLHRNVCCRGVRRFDGAHYADIGDCRQPISNKKSDLISVCLFAEQVDLILINYSCLLADVIDNHRITKQIYVNKKLKASINGITCTRILTMVSD